jgi:hypothetical protein
MSRQVQPVGSALDVPGAVTHGTSSAAGTSFIDLVCAEEDWVRQEFDELVAAGWGGSAPPCPDSAQGTHEPRRFGATFRPTLHRRPGPGLARSLWRASSRAPPRAGGTPAPDGS